LDSQKIIEIEIDGEESLYAHTHLLSERSEMLKAQVEESIETRSCRLYFSIMTCAQSTSMYLSYLYGQSMWVYPPEGEVDEQYACAEWYALTEVHELGMHHRDYDAIDAALDCMRNMLERFLDTFENPFGGEHRYDGKVFETGYGRLIADYMVYKPCKFKEWIEQYHRSGWDAEEDIDKALAKRFAEKSQRKVAGIAQPDLTERCRYHVHVGKGLP
jgi:hypothetical protein